MDERLYSLVDAVEAATGQRPHLSTVLRWAQRGLGGVRLQTVMLGGRRMTSVEAVRRFMEERTEKTSIPTVLSQGHQGSSTAAHREALRNLDSMGI